MAKLLFGVVGVVFGLASAGAHATETKTFKYDARGRLIEAKTTSGSKTVKTTYEHDKANNRKKKTTTGA